MTEVAALHEADRSLLAAFRGDHACEACGIAFAYSQSLRWHQSGVRSGKPCSRNRSRSSSRVGGACVEGVQGVYCGMLCPGSTLLCAGRAEGVA